MKMQYDLLFSVECGRKLHLPLGLSGNSTLGTALNFGDLYRASWKPVTTINRICICQDTFPSC